MRKRFDKYIWEGMRYPLYDFMDKERDANQHITYMLNRMQAMFIYEGLPDSIPQRILELYLQTNGNVCFYMHEGMLYVFTGGLGGEPDVYYMPTIYTIANPALKISKNLVIDTDCVVMPNDSLYMGLLPMFSRYATGLVENELSMKIASVNARIVNLISAPDDRTKASGEKYLQDIECGKQGIIAENAFLEGIRAQPYANAGSTNTLTNLIEYEQYLKAGWFNEIGLNANYNMKRESLNTTESQMNNDALLPLIDDMLRCRETGLEKVNAMFGTNITVSLASSWRATAAEIEELEDSDVPEDTTGEEVTESDSDRGETETE